MLQNPQCDCECDSSLSPLCAAACDICAGDSGDISQSFDELSDRLTAMTMNADRPGTSARCVLIRQSPTVKQPDIYTQLHLHTPGVASVLDVTDFNVELI